MAPYKRSKPAQTAAIVKDMEKRLPVDSEDPESAQRRERRNPPPRTRGATVVGTRKRPRNTA